jgi:hypothetical protein
MSMNPDRLKRIVASIKDTRSELDFQVSRLRLSSIVDTSIKAEQEHLIDLAEGYERAHHYLGILLNYQEGRLERGQQR